MNTVFRQLGNILARYLTKPRAYYERFSVISQTQLLKHLEPADLLLVEGNSRVSTAIKYLTQSTWSHVSFYAGAGELVEADLVEGVIRVPIKKYEGYNVRICRPVDLSDEDRRTVIDYMYASLGHQYDRRNIFDLMRYLFPTPPVPSRFRRDLIALGSGDPTRAICSTLIAQAFQSVKYPILPREVRQCDGSEATDCDDRLLESRHYTHFTPRDFDLSPYFEVVKPTLRNSFDYRKLRWLEYETAEQVADSRPA